MDHWEPIKRDKPEWIKVIMALPYPKFVWIWELYTFICSGFFICHRCPASA